MNTGRYIHKEHNVNILLYHLVFPAKYRRAVLTEKVEAVIKDACLELEKWYEIAFIEIDTDADYIHLLVQAVPTYSVTKLVTLIKSMTARQVFALCTEVKKTTLGGEFWSGGYFASTVGQHGNETVIAKYIKNQGKQNYTKFLQLKQKRKGGIIPV
jgi:REP element-mobilizing transposase RayT